MCPVVILIDSRNIKVNGRIKNETISIRFKKGRINPGLLGKNNAKNFRKLNKIFDRTTVHQNPKERKKTNKTCPVFEKMQGKSPKRFKKIKKKIEK